MHFCLTRLKAACLAYPCVGTELQVRLEWCLMGIKKSVYEANKDSRSKGQDLELTETLRLFISRDESAVVWTKREDAICFVRFVMDRIPTPLLEECIKAIQQGGFDRERNFLRALLELYKDRPLEKPTKEFNDIESYRRLEEVRRYYKKELKVTRESIERARDPKDYATLVS